MGSKWDGLVFLIFTLWTESMRAGKSEDERFSLDVDAGNNTEATRFFKSRVDCSPLCKGPS